MSKKPTQEEVYIAGIRHLKCNGAEVPKDTYKALFTDELKQLLKKEFKMKNTINIEHSHVVLTEILNKEIVSNTSSLDMTNWLLSNSNIKESERISYQNKQAFLEFRLQMLKELKNQVVEATEQEKVDS